MANSTIRRVGAGFRRARGAALLTTLLSLVSLVLAGCGSEEAVRHYKVPKPELVYAENHVEPKTEETAASRQPVAPPPAARQSALKYEIPAGWSEDPPVTMSVLTLGVRDGDRSAQLTVTPLSSDGGGLLANVNRWYGQIGLPQISESELSERTETLQVGGIEGIYLEASNDAAPGGGQALAGWIGLQPDRSWFVKFKGDRQLVRDQTEAFRSFLNSLNF